MPRAKWEGYERFCPFARALDVVGERWTLVIAHSLLGGPMRFTDLKADLPGIGTNVLSDRLRKLEAAGVVRREAGDVGGGVRYRVTERGAALAPALAEIRRWGVEELLGDVSAPRCYDLSHALPAGLALHETYEWRIDGRPLFLTIEGQTLQLEAEPSTEPALIVDTSLAFMRQWAAGEINWEAGRARGQVNVTGTAAAWDRMLVATNYPGRPADLAQRLLQRQQDENGA